ncbi:MAG: anthranilate synthase component I family protein [Thioalkalivibrionaceae bacterium]
MVTEDRQEEASARRFCVEAVDGLEVASVAWWSLLRLLEREGCGPWLLESALQGQGDGRWSILALMRGETRFGADAVMGELRWQSSRIDSERRDRLETARGVGYDGPFHGGWMFYLPYELAWRFEPSLGEAPRASCAADAFAVDVPAALVVDHARVQTWLVARDEHALGVARVHLARALSAGAQLDTSDDSGTQVEGSQESWTRARLVEAPEEAYLEAVRRARRLIIDGEVFQLNLSRAWRLDYLDSRPVEPFENGDQLHGLFSDVERLGSDETARIAIVPATVSALYQRLREANAAPFAAWFRLPDAVVISSSPERLVRIAEGRIETCPIAGTRPRGSTAETDAALRDDLSRHPKEIAEHVMLVDLERNDLGRVAAPGTVTVPSLLRVESYKRVHHLVSTIVATLADGVDVADALHATFPGGTITGCPKVHAIRRIHELEAVADRKPPPQAARGAYTGSLGYLSDGGALDSNILIRTLIVQTRTARALDRWTERFENESTRRVEYDVQGATSKHADDWAGRFAGCESAELIERIEFRTGAGIVFDSDPDAELAETRHKAKAMLEALGVAVPNP